MMPEQLKQVVIRFYRLGKRNQLQPVCCFSMSLMSFQENIHGFQPIRIKPVNVIGKSSTYLKTRPYQYHRVLHHPQELLLEHSPFLCIFKFSRFILFLLIDILKNSNSISI